MTGDTATKRLQLLIESRADTKGIAAFGGAMGDLFDKQKVGALKAKMLWEQSEKSATRAAAVQVRSVESVTRAQERADAAHLRLTQAQEARNERLAARYELAWKQAIRRVQVAQEAAAGTGALASSAAADAAAARSRYTGARVVGGVAAGASALGTGFLGAGALGLGAGVFLGRAGMNWQTYTSQQIANAPMSNRDFQAYKRRALALATATGATPEDILLAERYGDERGFHGARNRGLLQAGLMLGLPTGGSEALAPSTQAINTLLLNFPALRGNARKAAGMILAAAQNSAGTTVPDFVNAIPQTLTSAGHYGPKNGPDALAIIAALTQAGVPIDEANTQAYNLILRTAKPTPAVQKFLAGLKKDKGIDLTRDFSPRGVADKGILNVLGDIKSANLDPSTLGHLFPYMRAYLGALGLTGNFSQSALNIRDRITGGAGDKALNQNYKRYLGLDSTQAARLNQQFDVMSKTLGTALVPGILQLEKELIPVAKDFSQWTKEHKGWIVEAVKVAPLLIGIGGGLKGIGLALRGYNLVKETGLLAGAFRGLNGAVGGFTAKKVVLSTTFSDAEAAATTAIGTAGTGAAAGTGVLGLASAYGVLASAAAYAALVIENPNIMKGLDKAKRNTTNPIGKMLIEAGQIGMFFPMGVRNIFDQAGNVKDWLFPTPRKQGPGQAGRGRRDSSGNPNGAVPNGALFGDPGYKGLNELTNPNYPGGRAGAIAAAGMPGAVVHSDIPMPAGSPVKLPGPRAARYRPLDIGGTYGDPGGLHQLWGTPNGGKMMFYHLSDNNLRTIAGTGDGKGWYHGGQTVAISGNTGTNTTGAHLHVGMDAKARDYIYGMTWGQGWSGGTPGKLPKAGAGAGLMLTGSEKGYGGSFQTAGAKYHVDPSVLAGLGTVEGPGPGSGVISPAGYGSMGVAATPGAAANSGSPNYGTGAGGQIGGASQQMRKWLNWLAQNPKFVAAHAGSARLVLDKLGVKNPTKNEIMLVLALACFNAGPGGRYFDSFAPGDGHGMAYAMKVLSASMKANHGAFPSTYYTGQGDGRVPSGSSGSTGQVHYNGPGKASPYANYKPSDWANYWGGLASDTAGSMSSFFPGVFNSNKDPRNLPKWKRQIFDKLAQRRAFDEYEQYRSTVMADPNLSQAEKHRLISAAWKHYMYRHGHPEAEYIKRSRDNNMAEIRSDFLVGRERYKPPHHHPTSHPGKKPHPLETYQQTIARHTPNIDKKMGQAVRTLLRIEKLLKEGGDPRQHGQTMLHQPGQ